jgi:hypothetical protein
MKIEDLVYKTIEESVTNFFKDKKVKVRHVLDLIFPKERRIRSLIGGLETSLGTTLWEPLAKAFAEQGGFVILDEKEFNSNVPVIPEDIRHLISDFKEKKMLDMSLTHVSFFNELTKYVENMDFSNIKYEKIRKGQGVDVWIRKNGTEYLIDIKTTQINASDGPKFNSTMLDWYAYRAILGSKYKTKCLIAYPFNPHSPRDFWKKEGGKSKPLIPKDEALVADEFWDFLYGRTNTTALIFGEFERLGKSNFGEQFSEIFSQTKK